MENVVRIEFLAGLGGGWVWTLKAAAGLPHSKLGGDGVVAFQSFADLFGGDGTLAAYTPVVAAELDDGGGLRAVGFAGVEDERKAVAKLAENFFAAFAGGRAGKIGAGSGERDT